MIIILILITLFLDDTLILFGENWCWSVLGFKVLRVCKGCPSDPTFLLLFSPHVRKSRFWNLRKFCLRNPEYGKFLLVESWILGFGLRNTFKGSGIRLTIGMWNPSSSDKEFWKSYLESGIHGVESRIQDCLGFPYLVRLCENSGSWTSVIFILKLYGFLSLYYIPCQHFSKSHFMSSSQMTYLV